MKIYHFLIGSNIINNKIVDQSSGKSLDTFIAIYSKHRTNYFPPWYFLSTTRGLKERLLALYRCVHLNGSASFNSPAKSTKLSRMMNRSRFYESLQKLFPDLCCARIKL